MKFLAPLPASTVLLILCGMPQDARAADADALFRAIRSGDLQAVRNLLNNGIDPNVRDEDGGTALMNAAVYSDVEMMATIIQKGAAVNTSNKAGATALMWSVGDLEKVRLLIRHGADVNATSDAHSTPLILACQLPNATDVVALLLESGADVNANSGRFSPLMAAAARGDPATAMLLIRRGADVKAKNKFGFSAIHGASFNGTAELVSLLLVRDADPNLAVAGFTPAMWAAVQGKSDILKLLVERNANINARQKGEGTTALLWASTTGYKDVVDYLLDQGADPNVPDVRGYTPLSWAKRRGDSDIVKSLVKSGSKDTQPYPQPANPRQRIKRVTPEKISSAIERSLPLMLKSGEQFIANGESCVSCHHQSLPAMAIGLARLKGFQVDENDAKDQREAVLTQLDEMREDLLQGSGPADVLDPAVFLTGLAAEQQKANRAIDAAVQYIINRQRKDGSWKNVQHRPPFQQNDMVNTAFGIRSLKAYCLPGRSVEIEKRIALARNWLLANLPRNPTDEGLRLLGLQWSGATDQTKQSAARRLMKWQRDDGGWAQLSTLPSDSYATGLVLASLRIAGQISLDDIRFKKGIHFLLETQHNDGSWFVQTRSFPVQPYFESGFPHDESQFISISASAWATIALLHSRADE